MDPVEEIRRGALGLPANVVPIESGPFGPVDDVRLLQVLSAKNLRTKERAREDYLFTNEEGGGILSTIDFGQIFGETGTGKTLFSLALAVAVASGADFLHWRSSGARKVIYFDGELAETTLAERLELATHGLSAGERHLVDINLVIFNRDTAFNELGIELDYLDSLRGRQQVEHLVDLVGADIAVFDSRFCLLQSEMKEEGSMPKPLILSLRRRRCLGLWAHHSGKDTSRGGYGDKSAEFLMDFNIELATTDSDGYLSMTWRKKRKRTDLNGDLYADLVIQCKEGIWYKIGAAPKSTRKASRTRVNEDIALKAARELTVAARDTGKAMGRGHAGEHVQRITRDAVRDWLVSHGHYEAREGILNKADREAINKAIRNLIVEGVLAGDKEAIWLIRD